MRIPFSEPIDKLLNGGLEIGCITNFYGPPGSGKTQIAMCAAASFSKTTKVCFVDTEGGFSPERFLQISGDETFLKNVLIKEVKTWDEQKNVIRKLENIKTGLIIIDSIVALWRTEINQENFFEINQELARQLLILSKIARERKIPVIITTQIYEDIETGKIELSSRNIVKWWSKNLVELIHAGRPNCRIAIIRKSRSIPEGKKIEFEITSAGLKEVKFRLF